MKHIRNLYVSFWFGLCAWAEKHNIHMSHDEKSKSVSISPCTSTNRQRF